MVSTLKTWFLHWTVSRVPSYVSGILQSKVSLVQFLHKMNLLCLARIREIDSKCNSSSYKLSIEQKKPFQFYSFPIIILLKFLSLPGLLQAFGWLLFSITHWMDLGFFAFSDLLTISSVFHLVNIYSCFLSPVICFSALYSHELRKLYFFIFLLNFSGFFF